MRRTTWIAIAVVITVAGTQREIARAGDADDGFVVIVHPTSETAALDKKSVADAFLKKRTQWNNDRQIFPVDQKLKAGVRARFSRDILGRSVTSVRTYWNQRVFSGRGVPPPEVDSDAAVVAYVVGKPGAIGYVSAGADIKDAKVVRVK